MTKKGVCVCVSLVKSVLGVFLVHKIKQLEIKFSKLSLKPLSPGVEAEGIGKNRLLSARSPRGRAALYTGLWERLEPGGGEVRLLKQDRKSLALSLLGKLQGLISPASSFSQKPL